ncbi:hypothetical protein imdm_1488 [gamma proteobacterium IMCC2047]|nr:hypothetical protein imdm_1488 [gamma proteobacterium IMCC2047]
MLLLLETLMITIIISFKIRICAHFKAFPVKNALTRPPK